MATTSVSSNQDVPDPDEVRRHREAVGRLIRQPDEAPPAERAECARAAMEGLELGVPMTPSLYR